MVSIKKLQKIHSTVPERYICSGDIPKAKTFIPLGKKILEQYREFLSFKKLPTGNRIRHFFGMKLRIYVQINVGHTADYVYIRWREKKGYSALARYCFCVPHFAMARVETVTPSDPTVGFLKTGRFKYNISICTNSLYIYITDVYDANFGRYSVGQYVLATIGAEMEEWISPLDCDRFCLMARPRFDVLSLSPIHVPGEMQSWRYEDK